MPTTRFDPQTFFQRVENVALHVPATEVFSLFKRSLDLPAAWAAMVTRNDGDQTLVRPGGAVEAADGEDVLFVRTTPVEAALTENDLTSGDGFRCRVDVRVRLRINPERGDLLAFSKALLGSHRVVQTARIAAFLQPAVRGALAKLVAERDAALLVNGELGDAAASVLAQALEGPCFQAGLLIEGRPAASFESGTLRHVLQTKEEAAKRRAEHEAGRQLEEAIERAQREHLDHLTSLLARLKELAAAAPEAELPELLRTFSESQRSELYEALFEAERPESRTQWIVVAAGEELLFYDALRPDAPSRRLKVTGEAGPVRSVQMVTASDEGPLLMLGGQTGVYRQPIDRASPDRVWIVPDARDVRGGFNAVDLAGDRVFATHSELGLWEWPTDQTVPGRARFESVTRDAGAVRFVRFFGGRVYFTVDDRVVSFTADAEDESSPRFFTGSASTLTALCITDEDVFAGNAEGEILQWPKAGGGAPQRLHFGSKRPAESLWLLDSQGVRRLVFADTSLHVHAKVLGDSFACRYEAGGQTLRRVEIAPDLIVATNDLRDRLFCWSPGRPDRVQAIVSVSRLTGQSVQDVCLVPRSA